MAFAASLAVLAVATPAVIHADLRVDGRTAYTLTKTHESTSDGAEQIRSVYRDGSGREALVMQAELRHGRPVSVTVDQLQTKVKAAVRITPGRVDFERRSADGELQTSRTEVLGVVMVGPGLTRYLQSDEAWKRLVRGESVRVQIAAWERMDTYEFEFLRAKRSPPDQLVVLMRPTTWVIRAFVDEMRYAFDRRTRRLLRYRGPVGVKRMSKEGEASDLIAEVVYRGAGR